jgi:hypothetical protein
VAKTTGSEAKRPKGCHFRYTGLAVKKKTPTISHHSLLNDEKNIFAQAYAVSILRH